MVLNSLAPPSTCTETPDLNSFTQSNTNSSIFEEDKESRSAFFCSLFAVLAISSSKSTSLHHIFFLIFVFHTIISTALGTNPLSSSWMIIIFTFAQRHLVLWFFNYLIYACFVTHGGKKMYKLTQKHIKNNKKITKVTMS